MVVMSDSCNVVETEGPELSWVEEWCLPFDVWVARLGMTLRVDREVD
jgi:hypothetical protein